MTRAWQSLPSEHEISMGLCQLQPLLHPCASVPPGCRAQQFLESLWGLWVSRHNPNLQTSALLIKSIQPLQSGRSRANMLVSCLIWYCFSIVPHYRETILALAPICSVIPCCIPHQFKFEDRDSVHIGLSDSGSPSQVCIIGIPVFNL